MFKKSFKFTPVFLALALLISTTTVFAAPNKPP